VATVEKRVTFFDVRVEVTDPQGVVTLKKVKGDFWAKAFTKVDAISAHRKRVVTLNQVRYYGGVQRPTSPAIAHLQIGRLRDLSEHLEQTDLSSGVVSALTLPSPDLRVSEPTFIVPFGGKSRVAMLSPGKLTRHETLARWLTDVLNLAPKGKSIRFVPVVDPDALAKLAGSTGVVGVEFNIDAGHPLPTNSGSLMNAVDSLQSAGPSTGTLTVGWSLGYDGGSAADRNLIKDFATKIATGRFAHRAKANLVIDDGNGKTHREAHDLIIDRVVQTVKYSVQADQQTSTAVILDAIAKSIVKFNQLHP